MIRTIIVLTTLTVATTTVGQENRLWTNSALGFSMELPKCIEKHPWRKNDDYSSSFRMGLWAGNCKNGSVDKSLILAFDGSPSPFDSMIYRKVKTHFRSYQEIQGHELVVSGYTYSKPLSKDGLIPVAFDIKFGCHDQTINLSITKHLSPLLVPKNTKYKKVPIPGFPTPKMIEIAKSLKCVEQAPRKHTK